jgi:hypothetical protein
VVTFNTRQIGRMGPRTGLDKMESTKPLVLLEFSSLKSNPSSVPQGIVDSYSTLSHMGGGNSCGGYTLMMVARTQAG